MRIFTVNNWNDLNEAVTDSGCFVGVAIGPDSDEGVVKVNGVTLAGGRALPLKAKNYVVERLRSGGVHKPTLQLMLFEHLEELACNVARPNRRYTAHDTQGVGLIKRLNIPFTNRKHAQITITAYDGGGESAAGLVTRYMVQGSCGPTYEGIGGLPTGNTFEIVDEVVSDTTISFHIGGTDHAEMYDYLAIWADHDASADGLSIIAEVSGELGV